MAVPIYPPIYPSSSGGLPPLSYTAKYPKGERRWKILIISPEILLNILNEGIKLPFKIVSDSLPKDAKIVRMEYVDQDFSSMRPISPEIRIAIESREFPIHVEGEDYEMLRPVMEQISYIELQQEAKDILKRLISQNYG